MFNRQYRLPAQTKLNHPNSYFSQSFVLKVSKNNLLYSRFCFIIGKKIHKQAVKRNKSRRRFRACIEDMQTQIKNGYDMLFILKQGIGEKDKESLTQEITIFFKENGKTET